MNIHTPESAARTVAVSALIVLACLAFPLPAIADWQQVQRIPAPPPGTGAQFGSAVSINGNTMVVGARFDSTTAPFAGAAYVYVLNGTTWTQQGKLLATGGAANDNFGSSVAVSEDTIVVGAYHADASSAQSDSGAAYVFVRNGTTWTQQQKLTPSTVGASDEYGNAVAIIGEAIVVGAHFADLPSQSSAGAAFLFRRSGTTWTEIQKLGPSGGVVLGDYFGESVAIGGISILVGSSGADIPFTEAGAVYVFREAPGGAYSLQQKVTIPGGGNGDHFGGALSFEGNTFVAGAREHMPAQGKSSAGAAYVFEFDGTNWTSQGKLLASDGLLGDRFGWSVAVSSDVVAVGARGDDTAAGPDAGSTYVFTRSGATWSEIQKLAPTDPAGGDRFGGSVALSFGHLVAAAPEKALTSPTRLGTVYYFTYDRGPGIWVIGVGFILLVVLAAIMLQKPLARGWARRVP